ncbi:hypothetical protein [Streptomyces sp. enrichment culture]|uniref:hypothetical protein n=1 Tax=Streptomyces sp. enrichment culture TaxID=1795815 RepID=UPI003F54F706
MLPTSRLPEYGQPPGRRSAGPLAPTLPLPPFSRAPAFLTSALAIPLALVVVPCVLLRRITHRKPPKLAIGALVITLPAAIVLAVVTREAAEERGLQERGRWTEAVVVDVDNGKTDECALRTRDGREISPPLTDGCDPGRLEPGDRLRVLYDPRGMAGPLEDEGDGVDLDPGAYTGVIGGLAALTVVAGAWGCARLSRGDA